MDIIDFACGLAAGWSQIIVGHPLDFIKTKFQTTSLAKRNQISVKNFMKQIYRDHGLLGFYRGASSLFFGFGFIIAVEFTIYEFCKKFIQSRYYPKTLDPPEEILKIWEIGASGFWVGFWVSFIYCPIEYAKIIKQTSGDMKSSSLRLLLSEIRKNNLNKIYQGLSATLFRESIGSIIYYGMYELTVRSVCSFLERKRKFAEYTDFLLGGAVAGLSYWIVSYPWDVIKTQVQAGRSYQDAVKNIRETAYRGFGTVAFRSVIVNAVSFATFEQTKGISNMFRTLAMY